MKIIVRDAEGRLRVLEEGYSSESELQGFLERHADLIPVDELGSSEPLLCIGKEVGVGAGAEDLLYVDRTGLLTIVETKLGRNPAARREVVGQILEYAAMMGDWTADDLVRKAEAYLGRPLEQALSELGDAEDAPDASPFDFGEFVDSVEANLRMGRFRLIVAVDDPPEPLVRTVEFVNRSTRTFELLLLQLNKFSDTASGLTVFVPRILGASAAGGPRPKRREPWTEEAFFDQLSRQAPPEAVTVVRRLLDFAKERGRVVWGKGNVSATFRFTVDTPFGSPVTLYTAYGHGGVELDFATMKKRIPGELVDRYRALLRGLDVIPREVVEAESWKQFDAVRLAAGDACQKLLDAVGAFVEELQRAEG
ncbi:MAG TPA: hypothetical protein VNM43_09825 [Dehalococcoidia bacterium]|nr:hypothetical protein [Dehalococcoidia bacterium]